MQTYKKRKRKKETKENHGRGLLTKRQFDETYNHSCMRAHIEIMVSRMAHLVVNNSAYTQEKKRRNVKNKHPK